MIAPVSPDKHALLEALVFALGAVPDMAAVALGGSHARGTHTAQSDLDIGLYYDEAAPFAIEDIVRIAKAFSASGAPTVTGFYEWGPFVNGGAWIDNAICKVDFLYRSIVQLERTVADAKNGKWTHSFDQQPPFGFRSVTLLGELHCCRPLHDPSGVLARLKSSVATYPPALKATIVQDTLWGAEFAFIHAEGFAESGDVPNTVATMTRIYHYLLHAIFALNERYFISDKRVASEITGFSRTPKNFAERISTILAHPGAHPNALEHSLRKLEMLFHETVLLAGELYRPRFSQRGHQH